MMLKLLLSHWQSHREPLPFVLTDDPLYCNHLTKSPFPEVYSVNRINPIFEEDEEKESSNSTLPLAVTKLSYDGIDRRVESNQFKTFPTKRNTGNLKDNIITTSNFVLKRPVNKTNSNAFEYSRNLFRFYPPDPIPEVDFAERSSLKRSISDEAREDETKSSDDTGYSSSNQFKSLTTLDSDGSVENHPMSSDSDDCSHPEAVIVSADVHRVSTPDDILVRSPSSQSSANYSYRSYGSSPEPFDSLTMSSVTDTSAKELENRRSNAVVKEKLQRLLEKGNTNIENKIIMGNKAEVELQKTKTDLMKSLTRALNNKLPKHESETNVVTRSDDTHTKPQTIDRMSNSSSTSPKSLLVNSDPSGVTRQDESNSSSLSSFAKSRKLQHSQRSTKQLNSEKEIKSTDDSSDSQNTHKCKLCENAHRPLAFHQLLPGHWSYDNVYLPQMHGMLCPCMHHHHGMHAPPSSDDDIFYPFYHNTELSRTRHSWASSTIPNGHNHKRTKDANSGPRYSPDGETDSSNTSSSQLKKSISERRSLREPKQCKCEHCLSSGQGRCSNRHNCTCYCLSHRRVKFASDSDLSQHRHIDPFRMKNGMMNGDHISPALVMSLPHLNGHVAGKISSKENGKLKKPQQLIPRGLKEPVKMDELYGTYPINFRDWEAHYRRNFLQKRRKRALVMVCMATGIILVVGIAVALTFVFLRIKRPAS